MLIIIRAHSLPFFLCSTRLLALPRSPPPPSLPPLLSPVMSSSQEVTGPSGEKSLKGADFHAAFSSALFPSRDVHPSCLSRSVCTCGSAIIRHGRAQGEWPGHSLSWPGDTVHVWLSLYPVLMGAGREAEGHSLPVSADAHLHGEWGCGSSLMKMNVVGALWSHLCPGCQERAR